MSLKSQIETLLFVSSKPLTIRKLGQLVKEPDFGIVEGVLRELMGEYNDGMRGIAILENNGEFQMASASENAFFAKLFYKDELTSDLTKPSLETLTIIAYRGPLAKAELEELRGVNCSLILRNLMIRGLVEKELDPQRGAEVFSITMDFLAWLGLSSVHDLPEYEQLCRNIRSEDIYAN